MLHHRLLQEPLGAAPLLGWRRSAGLCDLYIENEVRMMMESWPQPVAALPLLEVGNILGLSQAALRELIAQRLIGVCTRRPLAAGFWGMTRPGLITGLNNRQPFNGRTLARLVDSDAITCLLTGRVSVAQAHVEPASDADRPECLATTYANSTTATPIAVEDLLISRVEFERFTREVGHSMVGIGRPSMSDAALGAATRQRMQELAELPRDEAPAREAEYRRWQECAAEIQRGRPFPASKRQLAGLVKKALGIPDSERTIRAHI